jgi:hypothetical protein
MRRASLVHLRPWSCISTPALRQLPRPLGTWVLGRFSRTLHLCPMTLRAVWMPASVPVLRAFTVLPSHPRAPSCTVALYFFVSCSTYSSQQAFVHYMGQFN